MRAEVLKRRRNNIGPEKLFMGPNMWFAFHIKRPTRVIYIPRRRACIIPCFTIYYISTVNLLPCPSLLSTFIVP